MQLVDEVKSFFDAIINFSVQTFAFLEPNTREALFHFSVPLLGVVYLFLMIGLWLERKLFDLLLVHIAAAIMSSFFVYVVEGDIWKGLFLFYGVHFFFLIIALAGSSDSDTSNNKNISTEHDDHYYEPECRHDWVYVQRNAQDIKDGIIRQRCTRCGNVKW
jgi:hypothetical protein